MTSTTGLLAARLAGACSYILSSPGLVPKLWTSVIAGDEVDAAATVARTAIGCIAPPRQHGACHTVSHGVRRAARMTRVQDDAPAVEGHRVRMDAPVSASIRARFPRVARRRRDPVDDRSLA